MTRHSTSALRIAVTGMLLVAPMALDAQGQPQASTPQATAMRDANRLDSDGRTREARAIFRRLIDSAATPAARAQAQRAMAMSYAFDGDCANTVKYEEMVIAYWRTREAEEPQNAFYQQGEMANEAARVCIDVGEIEVAAKYYELGSALGNREPEPRTHPRTLWDYRLHHALARLAARRGHKGDAEFHVVAARRALDADTAMASAQARFFPYLTGYVAFYTNDLANAEAELTRAVVMDGNNRDPFMHALLGMTYEKQGRAADAKGMFQKSYDLATSHNPPAAFARPFARKKLGLTAPR